MAKRQIEVFTAGCPVCQPTVELVREIASPDCDVTVYDLRESGVERAESYAIKTLPAVVVDGRLARCCERSSPNREQLLEAGIGRRLG